MRRVSVILAAVMIVCFMGSVKSEAFKIGGMKDGIYYSMSPEAVTPVNISLASINDLYRRAMYKESIDHKPDPKAQYELGVLFYTLSQAVEFEGAADDIAKAYACTSNLNQAAYWLRRAARADYAPACYLLSVIDFWFMEEREEAESMLNRAAELGHARAQARKASIMLRDIPGEVKVDASRKRVLKEVLELGEKSARQGDAYGMCVLSWVYGNQNYSGYNRAESEQWKQKALAAAANDPSISVYVAVEE